MSLLPMEEYRAQFLSALKNFQVVIVVGEPGCGKTTKIPSLLLQAGFATKGKIVITEPRRIAAITAARRVASERKEQIGKTIGYHVRFDSEMSEQTRVLFVTDGMLMQESRNDPLLRKYSVIVVDEAHERNLYTDFALCYLKSLCQKRPDLKVVISSATIDPLFFACYFKTLGIVQVPGRMYPVEYEYVSSGEDLAMDVARQVAAIHTQRDAGDVLVFLPGVADINRAGRAITDRRLSQLVVMPLYGGMEPKDQERVFDQIQDRKIILATNIAQTSVTIPGVRYVVDTLLERQPGYDADRDVETLYREYISQASATQRAGRAGRTQDGVCIRLMSQQQYNLLPRYGTPEITRSPLDAFVLNGRRHGIENIRHLDLMTRPTAAGLQSAVSKLTRLEVLDSQGVLTDFGRQISAFTLDPILARFIAFGAEEGCLKEAATITAFLSVRNLFLRDGSLGGMTDLVPREFADPMGDLYSYLRVWYSYQGPKTHQNFWCTKHRINPRMMQGITRIRAQIIKEAKRARFPVESSMNRDSIGRAIIRAFGDNLCEYDARHQYICRTVKKIELQKQSSLYHREPERFVCVSLIDTGNKIWATGCVEVQPEWASLLPTKAATSVKATSNIGTRIAGVLTLSDHRPLVTAHVYVDPTRQDCVLTVAPHKSLILDLAKLPCLNMGLIARSTDRARAIPLTKAERTAPFQVFFEEDVLPLESENSQGLQLEVTDSSTEASTAIAVTPAVAHQFEDRLLTKLLDQPLSFLSLTTATYMKVLGGGVGTVRELTECCEEDFQRGYGKKKAGNRFTGISFEEDEVEELKSRLAQFDLRFSERSEAAFRLFMSSAGFTAQEPRVSEAQARSKIGDEDFELCEARHSTNPATRLQARNELTAKHRRLAFKLGVGYQFVIPAHEQDRANEGQDYAQEGIFGLMTGVQKFDPFKGFRISTYLTWWIRQAITRYIQNGGVVRVPVHMRELMTKVKRKIGQFRRDNSRMPDRAELCVMIRGKNEDEIQAALDALKSFTFIPSLDKPVRSQIDSDADTSLHELIADWRYTTEEDVISQQFSAAMIQTVSQSSLIEFDRQLITLRFGIAGEDEHSVDELAQMFQVRPGIIEKRILMALDQLRTRGNWEEMRKYRDIVSLPEAQKRARWSKALRAFMQVLQEAESSWTREAFLTRLATLLELPLDSLFGDQQDVTLREAQSVAAALLWSPGLCEIEEIATAMRFAHSGKIRNMIATVGNKLRRSRMDKLAEGYQPPKLASSTQDDDGWLEDEEEDASSSSGQVLPVAQIRAALDRVELSARMRAILEGRMGLETPPQTLEQLGEELDLTRERVRQIQAVAIGRVEQSEIWKDIGPTLDPIFDTIERKRANNKQKRQAAPKGEST